MPAGRALKARSHDVLVGQQEADPETEREQKDGRLRPSTTSCLPVAPAIDSDAAQVLLASCPTVTPRTVISRKYSTCAAGTRPPEYTTKSHTLAADTAA
jgi:hypothetical protein